MELQYADGKSADRTFGGHTFFEAAHIVLKDGLCPPGVAALMPAATELTGVVKLLAFTTEGRLFDSNYRLVGVEG